MTMSFRRTESNALTLPPAVSGLIATTSTSTTHLLRTTNHKKLFSRHGRCASLAYGVGRARSQSGFCPGHEVSTPVPDAPRGDLHKKWPSAALAPCLKGACRYSQQLRSLALG